MPHGDEAVKFELGMEFTSKGSVKEAIKHYALERKKNLHFTKNDKIRMVVKCLKGCPFNLRFSNRSVSDCWQVGSFTELHNNCYKADKNKQAKTKN